MAKTKYTKEEFLSKFSGASVLEWDAYCYGFLHGTIDAERKQLKKMEETLEELNERTRHFKSGLGKNSQYT